MSTEQHNKKYSSSFDEFVRAEARKIALAKQNLQLASPQLQSKIDFSEEDHRCALESAEKALKIIIAEDDSTIRSVYRSLLGLILKEPHFVNETENGQQAFDVLRTCAETYDLIITDIKMPGMDGLQLATRARKEVTPDIPILFVTGHGDYALTVEALEDKNTDHLQKPVEKDDLAEKLKSLLGLAVEIPSSEESAETSGILTDYSLQFKAAVRAEAASIACARLGLPTDDHERLKSAESCQKERDADYYAAEKNLLGRQKILVIDTLNNRKEITELMHRQFPLAFVATAKSAGEAYEILDQKEDYDLVIANAYLKGMNSGALVDGITGERSVPVILTGRTSRSKKDAVSTAVENVLKGALDFVYPFDKARLADSVRKYFSKPVSAERLADRKPDISWLEAMLVDQPDNSMLRLELSKAYFFEGSLDKANEHFQKISEKFMDSTKFSEGMEEFISLHKAKVNENDAVYMEIAVHHMGLIADRKEGSEKAKWLYKVGEYLLQIADINPTNSQRLLRSAEKNFIESIRLDSSRPEARFALSLVRLKNGDEEGAYNNLVTLINSFGENKWSIPVENGDVNDAGLQLSQLFGQHSVLKITPRSVVTPLVRVKVYSPGKSEKAHHEYRNLTTFGTDMEIMNTKTGETWILKGPQPGHKPLVKDENYSFLQLSNCVGKKLSRIFPDISPSERKMHLDWITDSCMALGVKGAEKIPDLEDARTKELEYETNGSKILMPFHVYRLFTKFVDSHEQFDDIVLPRSARRTVQEEMQRFLSPLIEAPDFSVLMDIDNNIRNYLIDYSGIEALASCFAGEEMRRLIDGSTKIKVDTEGNVKRVFLLDLMTSSEHELAALDNESEKYYAYRGLANLIIRGLMNQGKDYSEVRQAVQSEDLKDSLNLKDSFEFKWVKDAYGVSMQRGDFELLYRVASAMRHLTISGDKAREIYRCKQMIKGIHSVNPSIRKFVNGGSMYFDDERLGNARMRFKHLEASERGEGARMFEEYITLQQEHVDLTSARLYHLNKARARIAKTRKNFPAKFMKLLTEVYINNEGKNN